MTVETNSSPKVETGSQDPQASVQTRQMSTIDFPYKSLDAAEEVALAVYKRTGLSPCDIDELAAEMGQTVSGSFRQKTASAKTFGLVDKDGRSAFLLAEIGERIVTESTAADARVDAFLNVPLYRSVYEKYRGHKLPPIGALEREMGHLGVSHRQTSRARRAFERSAEYAGFFEAGKDRLVKPRVSREMDTQHKEEIDDVKANDSGEEFSSLDPIIQGLLERLPQTGEVWPEGDRKKWLSLLEGSFDLIYKDSA